MGISGQLGHKWLVGNIPGLANLDIDYIKVRELQICGYVNY